MAESRIVKNDTQCAHCGVVIPEGTQALVYNNPPRAYCDGRHKREFEPGSVEYFLFRIESAVQAAVKRLFHTDYTQAGTNNSTDDIPF